MYSANVSKELPEINKSIGFDLMKRDWIPPYGKGEIADFIFTGGKEIRGEDDFDSNLRLTFSNPKDGLILKEIVRNKPQEGSLLKLPHSVPQSGYINSWAWNRSRKNLVQNKLKQTCQLFL